MSISLECKKVKRTGFFAAFVWGGILAAAVPIVNMSVRSEMYLAKQGSPIQILLDANWQMMTMLNVLLVIAGACLLYHMEYVDNAMEKMKSLPIRESSVFFGKVILTVVMSILALAIEAGAAGFCCWHWFGSKTGFWSELCKHFGYGFLLMLPCICLSLLISQFCKNMWASLGIGVVCVFTAVMLPAGNFLLSLFPFAMPFQILADMDAKRAVHYIYAAAAELILFGMAEIIVIKVRRAFQ